ncbi:MAG: glycosyltransferase, partial [bacterium]
MKNFLVSVVVTTKNEAVNIANLLKSVKLQDYKNIEIVVVDNNSVDDTKNISKKYTNKIYNLGPERSFQRNFGVKKSKGDYVLILDADMVLSKDVISECVRLFIENQKVGGVVIPEKSYGENFWAKTKSLEREVNRGEDYFEAARFFPKNIFNQFGGYDTTLTGPEDWDLPQRISKKYKILRIN